MPNSCPLTKIVDSPSGCSFITIRLPSASLGRVMEERIQQYSQVFPQVNPVWTGSKFPSCACWGDKCSIVRNASHEKAPNGTYKSSFSVRCQCFSLSRHSACIMLIFSSPSFCIEDILLIYSVGNGRCQSIFTKIHNSFFPFPKEGFSPFQASFKRPVPRRISSSVSPPNPKSTVAGPSFFSPPTMASDSP